MEYGRDLPRNSWEWRRLRAVELKQSGWSQRDIATALDVTEGAVSQWMAAAREGGIAALRSRPAPGPGSRLSPSQLRLIPDFLWHGAESYGFQGELWTCARVKEVIRLEFGVSYSISQMSRILKRIGWTPQVPITRAIQRDEEAISHWRTDVWPELKARAQTERRSLIFVDESGFYLLPGVVRTYAPRGVTPVVHEWQTRDHLSVMGGITPEGKVYTLVRQEALNGLHSVLFLNHLLHTLGKRLLVIWDGSQIHRRKEIRQFLSATHGASVHLESLPPYAPDLNPAEWAWRHLKMVELHNIACMDMEELDMELHLAIDHLRRRPALVRSFFAQAGLL